MVGKLPEFIIQNHIVQCIHKNYPFSNGQQVFISGRPCTIQSFLFMEQWTKLINDGNNVNAIYLDFKKM